MRRSYYVAWMDTRLVLALVLAACNPIAVPESAALDAGLRDAGAGTVGDAAVDAGTRSDGAVADASAPDAAVPEAPSLGRPAGVFGGGPFYDDAETVLPRMKQAGFDTLVLWTLHVEENGDLVLNDRPLVSEGVWIGRSDWPAMVEALKTAPTTVSRLELGLGSAGVRDFRRIASLIAAQGTGRDSILARNFAVLRAELPSVDAINLDDESDYDVEPTAALCLMLAELGYHITLTPFEAERFWVELYDTLEAAQPGLVDRVMLQLYAGGRFNQPAAWASLFSAAEIEVGLWSRHGAGCGAGDSPARVAERLAGWRDDIAGGWMWLLDDMIACDATYPAESYAEAIHGVFSDARAARQDD
jgi:hypothetical protein